MPGGFRGENPVRRLVTLAIRLYQRRISPFLGPRCRFDPSCSEVARRAVAAQGVFRGLAQGLHQLSRCHPWGR